MASKDWNALRDLIEAALKENLKELIEGSIEDLNGPLREASNRLVVAIRRGPTAAPIVAEIKDYLLLKMLEKKIEAKQRFNNVFDVVLGIGLNLLFNGAVGGLAALRS